MLVAGDSVFKDELVTILLQWFRDNGRDLPWRRTYDPYHVWISEIMLQQTQMDRGVAYFTRWIERFPDVRTLAASPEQEVLRMWQGLGYYARARNLHRTAKILAQEMNGVVPCDYDTLIKLPGVGPYTAAAIASIAGNNPHAVVDANVGRIYARIFNIAEPLKLPSTKKKIEQLAASLLPGEKARKYNQAVMDFGGMICLPRYPLCSKCPVKHLCEAYKYDLVQERPLVAAGRSTITLNWAAYIVVCRERVFIYQRPEDGVWAGLWEFPILEGQENSDPKQNGCALLSRQGLAVKSSELITEVRHQYTHHKIVLAAVLCELSDQGAPDVLFGKKGCWVPPVQLQHFGLPAGARKIVEFIRKRRPEIFDYQL